MKNITTVLIVLAIAMSSVIAQTIEFSSYRVENAETKAEIESLAPLRKTDKVAYMEKMNEICDRLTPYIDAKVKADETGKLNYEEGTVSISGQIRPFQTNPDGYPLNIKVTDNAKPIYGSTLLMQPDESIIASIVISSAIDFSRIKLIIE